jgi:hypothetical protein
MLPDDHNIDIGGMGFTDNGKHHLMTTVKRIVAGCFIFVLILCALLLLALLWPYYGPY